MKIKQSEEITFRNLKLEVINWKSEFLLIMKQNSLQYQQEIYIKHLKLAKDFLLGSKQTHTGL